MTARYRFIPWVRQGTSTFVQQKDPLVSNLSRRARVNLLLELNNRGDPDHQAPVELFLYGPGDVTGIDPRVVIRTDPPHLTGNFEPNYLPVIEFDPPDFPWLFTPATGDTQGRLRPWICLIVVRKQEGVSLETDPGRPLPVLRIQAPAHPRDELPDLAESWAWAHAQVVTGGESFSIQELLADHPLRNLSRLICPRQLQPNTSYYACLVPAFDAGRKAGLGEELSEEGSQKLGPAWAFGEQAPNEIVLPVYFYWEFSTAIGGDFESLVLEIKGKPLPKGVGTRRMRVQGLGFGLPDLESLPFAGALRPLNFLEGDGSVEIPSPFHDRLREILNQRQDDQGPVVAPAIYGSRQALQPIVPQDDLPPHWLRELNLDPRYRAVAGLGTLVIQDEQEQLMASAWEQGSARQVNSIRRSAQFTQEVLTAVLKKHFQPMSSERLLQFTGPIHSRVLATNGIMNNFTSQSTAHVTLSKYLRQRQLPETVVSSTFRQVFRPNGPLIRRLKHVAARPTPTTFVNMLIGSAIIRRRFEQSSRDRVTIQMINSHIEEVGSRVLVRKQAGEDIPPETIRYLAAAKKVQGYFSGLTSLLPDLPSQPGEGLPDFNIAQIVNDLITKLDPNLTVPAYVGSQITLHAQSKPNGKNQSDPLEIVLEAPNFPQPMVTPLRELFPELLLIGFEAIPADTVTLIETNPEFIESYLVGLNHEMGRELLWREYPNDQRRTYFLRFWEASESSANSGKGMIPEIHTWSQDSRLGENVVISDRDSQLVLLIRGQLLQRYPDAIIYASKAVSPTRLGSDEKHPIFRGRVEPDITFLGFDLTFCQAIGNETDPGWFFVIQEQPTSPRFGLNVSATDSTIARWDQLAWQHVKTAFGHISIKETSPGNLAPQELKWGWNAAHMAAILRQLPVRVVYPANLFLPTQQGCDEIRS